MGQNTMDLHIPNPIDQDTLATDNKGNKKYNIKQWSKEASSRK